MSTPVVVKLQPSSPVIVQLKTGPQGPGGAGAVTVADDIAKSTGTAIDRVRGFRGVPLVGSDGAVPPLGGTWKYHSSSGYIPGNPVLPGWADFTDYGAVPSNQDGTGTITDCTAALHAAIAAVTTDHSATNQPGVVYIPPAPVGQEWYFAGADSDMLPTKCVEISRCVHIVGAGTGYQRGGSRVKFGPLCSGFRFTAQSYSSDGGDSSGSIVEGLTTYNTPIAALTGANAITVGWKHAHTYSVGDKIRPVRFQNLYYECVKAGISGGPAPSVGDCTRFASVHLQGGAINRWAPGTTYVAGNKVYPNIACKKVFVCTVGGKTINRTDSEVTPATGKYDSVGEPDWFTDPLDPHGSLITTVIEAIDENGNPGPQWQPSEDEFEPLWEEENLGTLCYAKAYQPNHPYMWGAQVFATGRFDVIFVARTLDFHTPQTSGGSEPAAFSTAVIGNLITDGNITWECIAPIGLITDGTVVWAARFAGAYLIEAPYITVKRPYIGSQVDGTLNCPTAAIGIFSGIYGSSVAMNSDFTKVLGPGFIDGCGVCIYAHGPDSNAGVIKDIVFGGEQYGEYGATGEHCVYDRSFLGNYYEGCVFNGSSGWFFASLSQAATSSLTDCYMEGAGLRRSPMYGPVSIRGGTVAFNCFRTSRVWPNVFLSTGSTCVFADRTTGLYARGFYPTNPKIELSIGLQDSANKILFMNAKDVQSPGTGDDVNGYSWRYGNLQSGWWAFTHGDSQWAYLVSGDTASIGGGVFWLLRGHLVGQTDVHFHFSDRDNAGDEYITLVGGMRQGDIVDRADTATATGRFYHNVNLGPTEGAHYGFDWVAGATYSVGTIVVPTQLNQTANHRAFQCTAITTGVAGGTEPAWPDTLGATVTDGGVTWTAIKGPLMAVASEIQSGVSKSVDLTAATVTLALTDDNVTVTAVGHNLLLPSAPFEGKWYSIKAGGAFAVTIDGNGKNIDGAATYTQPTNRSCTKVRYNSRSGIGQWEILSTGAAAGGTPGGANTDVQYNSTGAFGGDSGFTYDAAGKATLSTALETGGGTYATTGAVRLAKGSGIYARSNGGAADILLVGMDGAGTDIVRCGDQTATYGLLQSGQIVGLYSALFGYVFYFDGTNNLIGPPLIGNPSYSSPYSVHGDTSIALADANYTLATTDYQYEALHFTGALTALRTITFPAPAANKGYRKLVCNMCTGVNGKLTFSTGAGATVTSFDNQTTSATTNAAWLWIDSNGVHLASQKFAGW